MPLMKAQNKSLLRESAVVMELADLEQEASLILSSARAEAAHIVAEAKAIAAREAPQIREAARARGRKRG